MALFGTDMVQVTTPDGRTVTMPSQLAAQFPALRAGLQPSSQLGGGAVPPPPGGPVTLPSGGAPDWTPRDSATLTQQTPAPDPGPPPTGPVTSPDQVSAGGPSAAPSAGPVTDPAQMSSGGPANQPAPLTKAGLAKLSNADVYNAQSETADKQAEDAKKLGAVDASEFRQLAHLQELRDAESQRQLEADAKVANEQQAALQAKQLEYEKNAKAIANTPIDRGPDHPILAAIGIALAGIGTAMKKESVNPAMAAFYAAIDRKVAGQMQDLDKRRAGLADQKDALGMQRQSNLDRLALASQYRLGYLEQWQRKIETIKTMAQSDRSQANADLAVDNIQQHKNEEMAASMQREHDDIKAAQARQDMLQHQKAELGVQWAGVNQADRHFNKTFDEQKRRDDEQERKNNLEHDVDMEKLRQAALKAGQKDKADRTVEVQKRGVWDPSTATPLLDPEGRAKLQQADRIEAAARTSDDPARAAQQNAHAQALRDDAKVTNAVLFPSEKAAEDARPKIKASQDLINATHKLKAFLESDPGLTNREGWAETQAIYGSAAANYAALKGEKVGPRALDGITKHIMTFDSGSWTDRAFSKAPAIAALKGIEGTVKGEVDTLLKSNGVNADWIPKDASAGATSLDFGDKTAQEVGEGATYGSGKPDTEGLVDPEYAAAARAILQTTPLGGGPRSSLTDETPADEARRSDAENATDSGPTGLSPAATASVQALAKRDTAVSAAEHAEIVQALAAPIKAGRESLSWGVLSLLKDENPTLYRDVVNELPKTMANEIRDRDKALKEMQSKLPSPSPLRGLDR